MKLINGECIEEMKKIESGSIDMILCDLPYGTTNCKWDIVINFNDLWEQYNRIIKPNGVIALFGSEPFSSYLRLSNIKNYKYDWIWDKVNGGNHIVAKKRPLQRTENIHIFYKKAGKYTPIMELAQEGNKRPRNYEKDRWLNKTNMNLIKEYRISKNRDENLRYPKNVLTFNSRSKELNAMNRVHPTQKPIALLEYLIKTYTNENELVLDNTMGSGSTGVACVNTNRDFIGIELDEEYFEIAEKRIKEAQGVL